MHRLRSTASLRAAYRQSGSRVLSRIGSAGAAAVSIHYASHYLGPAQWGRAMSVVSLCLLLAGITDFGLASLTAREVAGASRSASEATSDHLVLRLLLTLPVIPVALGATALLFHGVSLLLIVALVPFLFASGITSVASSALVGSGRSQRAGVVDLVGGLCGLGAAVTSSALGLTLPAYLACVSAAVAVEAIFALLSLRGSMASLKPVKARLGIRLRTAAPMGLVVATNVIYLQADTVILAATRPAAEVGAYAIAYAVFSFVMFAPTAFMGAILPGFMAANDKERMTISQRALDNLIWAAIPIVTLVALGAPAIVTMLAGSAFGPAGPVLCILVPAAGLSFGTAVYGNLLVAVDKQSRLIPVVGAAATTNVLLNLGLDPWLGPRAAAAAMVVSEVVALIGTAAAFRRATGWRLRLSGLQTAVPGGLAMLLTGLATRRVGGSGWPVLTLVLVVSGATYVTVQHLARHGSHLVAVPT
jgi:O-antigen/teichoic acid export membrane protein